MVTRSRQSLLLSLLCSASMLAPATARATDQPVDPAPTQSEVGEPDAVTGDEIVVTAPRIAGQLDTDIAAEAELDEAAIASYGASSATDLLAALAPQTRSGRGRGSGQPVVLVNGRRISGFNEIRNLPSDAIAKVEVFPEEVALQYGYSADERVVNFVLKPNFRAFAVEDEVGTATQGGRFRNEIEPSLLRIGEKGRINLTGRWEHQTRLKESERDLIPASGNLADADFRTLLPRSDQYVLDATVQRSLDKLTDVSLNARVDQTDSLSLLGPDGGGGALERDSRARNVLVGASANGMVGKWRWSLTGNYTDADSRIFTDRIGGTVDRFDSSSRNFGGNATLSGTLAEGWAGPVRLTTRAGYAGQRFDSVSQRSSGTTATRLGRDVPSAFASLSIPLLDPDYDVGKIGRLSASLSGEVSDVSDFGTLKSWSTGLNWNVTRSLSLLASYNRDQAAPGVQQLGAATLVTPGVTYYDFGRGETVQIETVSGGNPALLAELRRDLKLGINWSPPMVEGLNLSVNYNRNRSDNVTSGFPVLTPEIEAAFPDRVTRGADGRLVRLDLRPVNYDRVENAQLRWGINFGKAFGQPQGGPGGPGGAGAPGGGRGPGAGGPPRGPGAGGPPRGPMMGMMGGGMGGRWQVSLYHTIKLDDTIRIRPGVPELDLLGGSATGNDGGSPRHLIEADGGRFYKGIGFRFSARYDSGSRVTGGLTGGDLKFGDLATFNLRAFINFDNKPEMVKAVPLLKGSRLRLSIDNLFDAQRRVTDASGAVPIRYQPDYLDPLGRYVELSWRKSF